MRAPRKLYAARLAKFAPPAPRGTGTLQTQDPVDILLPTCPVAAVYDAACGFHQPVQLRNRGGDGFRQRVVDRVADHRVQPMLGNPDDTVETGDKSVELRPHVHRHPRIGFDRQFLVLETACSEMLGIVFCSHARTSSSISGISGSISMSMIASLK
jgi:hypothetical protein